MPDNQESETARPLEGFRVLDLTRALAGPFCTTLLADLGADVIKVESPSGDAIRGWGPFEADVSLYHLSVNRNKRSLALDTRTEAGRELLRSMVIQSDVVVENFRRGVLDEMGIGPEWTRMHAPDTIITSISGYGPVGPLSQLPAFDQIAQGMAGLMSITGPAGNNPTRVGLAIGDVLAGMFAAIGTCAALAGRATGKSITLVETSLLESVLGILTFQAQRYLTGGQIPESAGNNHPSLSPYGVFATADRPLNIAVATQPQFAALCVAIDRPDLVADPRFVSGRERAVHREDLTQMIEDVLRTKPAADWLPVLHQSGVPAGAVNNMAEVFAEPQVLALEMVQTVTHPELGDVQVLRAPLRINAVPLPVTRPAPQLGEHGEEILREFGVTDAQLAELRAGLAIGPHHD